MNSRFKVLGINDDRDFCECCGKANLQSVVWIEDTETGDIRHFGSTCATAPAKGFGLDREIKSAIRSYKARQSAIGVRAFMLYAKKYNGPREFDGVVSRALDLDLFAKCCTEAATMIR